MLSESSLRKKIQGKVYKTIKKAKQGKFRRHMARRKLNLVQGFGKPWSAPSLVFRVEFMYEDEKQNTSNEMVHWVECRNFSGEERRHLKSHMNQHLKTVLQDGETIESVYVSIYVSAFLCENRLRAGINQAFIYPHATKKGSEAIRQPIYQIKWTESLEEAAKLNKPLAIVLKNCIWHEYSHLAESRQ